MSHKIVIDARESGTTTGRYIDKLIEHMDKLAPQHQIVILTHAERTEFFANIAPNFVILQTPFKEFSFDEQIGFLRQLRGLKADLVHFGMVQQPVMYHGNTVTTMHDLTTARFTNPDKNPLVFKAKQLVYKWVNKTAARKSAAIITPTQFVKDDVAEFAGVNPEKITVTYEAADFITDAPEPVAGLEGKQFIMYLGRPTPHKNLERLIDAFKELQETHPDLHLVLAGKKDANYRRHEARVTAEQIANITFTDFISEGQLRWLYQNCAAYIFPSLSEGFGLPGLEAMVHGAPVVSSNATCLPEVYGDAAQYFDPLNVSDITQKIAGVIDNASLRSELIAKGTEQANKYSWDRMAQQTLDLYESVLDNAKL
jgi:glycosyltransferase involved in cell wall biosynthesis